MEYALPRADQVPFIETCLEAFPSMVNELGVKGGEESGTISPGAVIANTVEWR